MSTTRVPRNQATVISELIRHAITGRTDGKLAAHAFGVETRGTNGYIARFDTDPDAYDTWREVRAEAFVAASAILSAFAGDPEAGWPTVSVEPTDPTNPPIGVIVIVRWER